MYTLRNQVIRRWTISSKNYGVQLGVIALSTIKLCLKHDKTMHSLAICLPVWCLALKR